MPKKNIRIIEFINNVEKFSVEFYKKCLLETNQFSTKYVLQNVIKNQMEQSQKVVDLAKDVNDEQVRGNNLREMIQDFSNKYVKSEYELDNLNFVEATHLSIFLTEYVIGIYQKIITGDLSVKTSDTLNSIVRMKQEYLQNLNIEYEKLRYK